MRTAIVTDTNSGISQELIEKYHITVVPMPVIIDGDIKFEGIDISQDELFAAIKADRKVTTSMPSTGDVAAIWNKVLKEYDELVYIPMSSGLSQSCNAARILAEDYKGRVHVVDNGRISVTMTASAIQGAQMAEAGFSGKEIADFLTKTRLDARVYLMVDDLNCLKRGGRVSAASAMIGTLLNIKPVLLIEDGPLEVIAKSRGSKAALRLMIDNLKKDRTAHFPWPDEETLIGIATAGIPDDMPEKLHEMMHEAFPNCEILQSVLPCSICVHTGPGAIGFTISHKPIPAKE